MLEKIKKILKKRKEISIAYLYGSFAKGLSDERSDVDIALILKDLNVVEKNPFMNQKLPWK